MDPTLGMDLNAFAESNKMRDGDQFPMRVTLFSQSGMMRFVWLPKIVDGRYRFLTSDGMDDGLPFYIEAKDGVWVANSGRSTAFVQKSRTTGEEFVVGHELPLGDVVMGQLRYNGEKYSLYAEIERPNDYTFLPYYFEDQTDYTIGRIDSNLICYPNRLVSRNHAVLHWKDGIWEIIDQNSSNGVYVNGKRVKQADLHIGDCVFIMGLYILVGSGFFSINNANERALMNTPKIRQITDRRDVYYPKTPVVEPNILFDRPPRKLNKVDPAPIEIDMPPMPLSANKIPLLLRMGNPLLMGGQALMTGNILMAMTSMVLPSMTQGLTEKDRKEYEAKRLERYREYLVEKKDEIRREKEMEERQLTHNNSDLNSVMRFAQTKDRLWERRRADSDFLEVRVGYGQIPMIAKKAFQPRKFQMEEDVLLSEMYALAEQPVVLENAPVLLSLMQDYIIGVLGAKHAAVELLRNMIIQIAVAHSYDEVKLVLLADQQDIIGLDFVRYLPHCWSDDRSIRFFASSQTDAQQLSKYLSQEFQDMLDSNQNGPSDRKKKTSYVVMVLSRKLFDCVEILKKVLGSENYCGISLIAALENIPKECSKIVDLRGQNRIIDLNHCDLEDQQFSMDLCDSNVFQAGLRQLMQTKLKLDSELHTLPPMLTFLDLYQAGRVEHLNPLKRWEDNDPVKSLAVPVGVGTDGGIFTLDLHEKRQGPHGLVAGMTGSGKSEFIITYILSMAVNFSPDEVAFILIDYKGGGLADAFEDEKRGIHLPHLVGTITNLDGASIQRSLMSIKSELSRRQAIFKKVKSETNEGTLDIYDYQRLYRSKKIQEPLPHLFIISDEFAELKKQQPEFMDELISAARIGRSLGVHLILATQKPSGVVNDQIWSNTKFRVCLRVQDRGDSMEMLKRPEAAELKNTGRFYLQVGYNEFFAMGQSAWCGAGYAPQDEIQINEDKSVKFLDNVGQTVLEAKANEKRGEAKSKQIVAVVQYLSDLAKQNGIQPRSLWMDPLPDRLELRTLMANVQKPANAEICALLGMVDDPERQEQFPLFLDMQSFHNMLLCGNGGSGKSTLLCTMLYTLVDSCSPEDLNYYILDLSGGVLSPFARMPHCGAYLTENDENDFDRLLSMIQDIIAERKKLYAEKDVFSFEAYRQVDSMPLVLVILDGFTNIQSFRRGTEYYNFIHEYMREASNYGIRFILSCNHLNEVSAKSKQEIDYGLALQAKDKYEYGDILNTKCQLTPPAKRGRGMCVVDGRPLEYHVAMPDCDADGQTRTALLKESLSQIAERYAGINPAKALPMADSEQEYSSFCADIPRERIPLGYSVQDMKKVTIPLQQLYDMSMYFGNPLGIRPVLLNLIYAAQRDHMDLVVMRRKTDTIFVDAVEKSIRLENSGQFVLLDTTEEDLSRLDDIIIEEIKARNVYRDMYCEQNGIPKTDRGRAKKAGKFIREHTRPMMVLFESFGDLCRVDKSDELTGELTAFFTSLKGYNIYFCGCFYPDEEGHLSGNQLMGSFNREELLLLFGGRYDRQCITNLPMDLRGVEQINPKYDRFMLKYQGSYHPMIMPCGALDTGESDPDEAPII